jgi:transcription elongation factor GreA
MAEAEAITPEGLAQLKAELEELEGAGRRAVAERIQAARELGDLSENAEYDAAKEEQALLEARIAWLNERLRNAQVVEADADAKVVTFGATVTVADVETGKTFKYTIVGPAEADVSKGRVSSESPVGKALIGAAPGDTVAVSTPRGERKLKIESLG